MSTLRTLGMIALLGTAVAAPLDAQVEDTRFVGIGSLEFPTSATGLAQRHFLRGVAFLHSFGWKQARDDFHAAQEIDPDFAMAFWGEALAYNHPLVSQMDPAAPRAALDRLAPTAEQRLAKAPTAREQGFLSAVEILWGDGDHVARRVGYMQAMERLHESYPDDVEVAAFYTLSMLSAAIAIRSDDADEAERLHIRAGAIALELFGRRPEHPGAPHYVIHAFDDPVHARLALEAARRFSEIAPAVSHARHMPTHVFIQLGMWELVSRHNQLAYEAARDLWFPGDDMGDAIHALDWGQYGDLMRGDYERAASWIRRAEIMAEGGFRGRMERGPANAPRAVGTLDLVKARYVVDTEQWRIEPVTVASSVHQLLATALSAYHLGDLPTLQQAESALASRVPEGGGPASIVHKEAAALLHAASGRVDAAIRVLDEAAAEVDALPPPNGAASPIKPVHELYGELLLDLGRPAEAAEKFEASLELMPNRPRSLLGLARAALAAGNPTRASGPYEALAELWAGREELPEMLEARRFWRAHVAAQAQGAGSSTPIGHVREGR